MKIIPFNIYSFLADTPGSTFSSVTKFKQDINLILKSVENPYFLFMDVQEGRVYTTYCNQLFCDLQYAIKELNLNYTIILDAENINYSKITNLKNVIYSDFMVITSYINGVLQEDQLLNESWNQNNKKGLFLPGRMERPHRTLLLSKLWERDFLHKIDWSCYIYQDNVNQVRQYISHYDDPAFNKFVSDCIRTLDFKINIDKNYSFNGYPFDVNLYRNTAFSIITESDFHSSIDDSYKLFAIPKITEKTYRALINKHPFICAWYPGMLEKLKSKGYKTFENYMPYPEYNSVHDIEQRIYQIIENLYWFYDIEKRNKFSDQIRYDTEFNYSKFIANAKTELGKLSHIFELDQNFTLRKLADSGFPRSCEFFGK